MNKEGEALKRVLIVDDSSAVRQRLVTILNNTEGVEVVGEAKDFMLENSSALIGLHNDAALFLAIVF